jgi:hypothetical protein
LSFNIARVWGFNASSMDDNIVDASATLTLNHAFGSSKLYWATANLACPNHKRPPKFNPAFDNKAFKVWKAIFTVKMEVKPMREAEGVIYKNKKCYTHYIVVPASLAKDSSFPFKDGDKILLRIEGEALTVRRADRA